MILTARSPVIQQTNVTPVYPFPPGTQTWRICKELALLPGGGRALLMQVAHPMIAQGIVDHSDFRRRPFRRLYHTLQAMTHIVFGDRDTAYSAARRVQVTHRSYNGVLPKTAGGCHEGRRYFADNPATFMWVFATLIDTAIVMYDALIAPLSEAEKAQFYTESCTWGLWMGITRDAMPADYRAFCRYMDEMCGGDILAVGDAGREVARAILYPHSRFLPGFCWAPMRGFTTGLLPVAIREKFVIGWSAGQEQRFQRNVKWLGKMLRLTPERWRSVPVAWRMRHFAV